MPIIRTMAMTMVMAAPRSACIACPKMKKKMSGKR